MRSELEPVRDAAVQPVLKVQDRLVVEAQRPPGDLELQVELAQQEVVRGDISDEGDDHAPPAEVARQHERQRRFVLAPDAAEQIELPGELEAEHAVRARVVVVVLTLRCGGARLADGRLRDAVDLRVEKRLDDAGPRARLLDACRGRPQIEVVGEGFANQRLQRRVVEDLEPRDVGERLRFRAVDESVLRRRRQWRPRVVGAHRAAGPERRQRDNDRDKRRHPHVSGSRARAAARASAARPPVSRPASWRRRR